MQTSYRPFLPILPPFTVNERFFTLTQFRQHTCHKQWGLERKRSPQRYTNQTDSSLSVPRAHAQLQGNSLAVIRPDPWISKCLYKWLVSKVGHTHTDALTGNLHEQTCCCSLQPPSPALQWTQLVPSCPELTGDCGKDDRASDSPPGSARGKEGCQTKNCPSKFLPVKACTHMCFHFSGLYHLACFYAVINSQEKNYDSLNYCSQIFMVPSLEENYISCPY